MRVLVSAASKHGATTEIGEKIAGLLRQPGIDVTVAPPDKVRVIDWYDAIVLGSAVYMGHWLTDAKRFVARHREGLASRSVWLFSSGPLGDPAMPKNEAVDILELMRITAARGHRTFAGKLDRGELTLKEKAMMTAVRAQEGDFRDWRDVEEWAATIAEDLTTEAPPWHAAPAGHQEGGSAP